MLGLMGAAGRHGHGETRPADYYVDTVPVEFNLPLFALINVATLMLCVLMLVAPSFLVSHIRPAKAMRYE